MSPSIAFDGFQIIINAIQWVFTQITRVMDFIDSCANLTSAVAPAVQEILSFVPPYLAFVPTSILLIAVFRFITHWGGDS